MKPFVSPLASQIERFLQFKRACGRQYRDEERELGGSSRQGCESCEVKVLAPSIACIRTASISNACGGNDTCFAWT